MSKPTIKQAPALTVAVIAATGNPTTTVPRIIPALFKAVYGSKKLYGKEFKPQGKLRGRYFYRDPNAPDEEKHFKLALPIPDGTPAVAQLLPEVALVDVEIWPAETVAEIVHVGPFSSERATLDRLFAYVAEQGYALVGAHEEEYLTKLDVPDERRRTILRHPVEKQ